jgi:hypothetical protein
MSVRAYPTATGLAVIAFVLAINTAFVALVQLFGYDDVLREPTAEILTRFRAAGTPLVVAWLAFALGALAFAPLSRRIEEELGLRPGWSGPASAFAQFVGLARWVFAVPALAVAHAHGDAAHRAAAETTFEALHLLLGAGVGELLGQLLLLGWTVRIAHTLWARGDRVIGGAGLATVPLWVAGLSEPLATVLPGLPTFEYAPVAFMAWEAWLLALGLRFVVAGRRAGRVVPAEART